MNIMKNVNLVVNDKNAKQPMRSTIGSAGYDIFAPKDIQLPKGKEVVVELPFSFEGENLSEWMVRVFVRSSFGIKKKVRIVENGDKAVLGKKLDLAAKNHQLILLNDSDEDLTISAGEHFAQFIVSEKEPMEEKNKLEFLTKEELGDVVPVKGVIEVVRPNVYDYVLDEEVVVPANAQISLPSGVRTVIADGTWTAIDPHDEIKDRIMLANQKGVIDKDYAYNESTKGNCFLALVNLLDEEVVLPKGTRVARWYTEKYFTFEEEIKTDKVRTGGIGHT